MDEFGKPFSYDVTGKIARNNIIRVETDAGITGIGPVGRKTTPEEIQFGLSIMRPYVIGKDPSEPQRIFMLCSDTMGNKRNMGNRLKCLSTLSGLEIALWDIMGKKLKVPVYTLLGGRFRERVRVYASIAWQCAGSPKLFAEHVLHCVERGFDIVKLRGGWGIDQAIEQFRVCRKAVGTQVKLAMDLNWGYNTYTAIKLIKELEKYNPLFIECPIPPGDPEAYSDIRKAVSVPIMAGENQTLEGIKTLIRHRWIDIVNPDAGLHGGLWMLKSICEFAEWHGIPVVNHDGEEILDTIAHLHLGAATPNHLMMEFWPRSLDTDFLTEPLEFEDGFITVPSAPGLGVTLNEELLSKHTYEPLSLEELQKKMSERWGEGYPLQRGGAMPYERWLSPYPK